MVEVFKETLLWSQEAGGTVIVEVFKETLLWPQEVDGTSVVVVVFIDTLLWYCLPQLQTVEGQEP